MPSQNVFELSFHILALMACFRSFATDAIRGGVVARMDASTSSPLCAKQLSTEVQLLAVNSPSCSVWLPSPVANSGVSGIQSMIRMQG